MGAEGPGGDAARHLGGDGAGGDHSDLQRGVRRLQPFHRRLEDRRHAGDLAGPAARQDQQQGRFSGDAARGAETRAVSAGHIDVQGL
ncbi:hypothetical protein D3C75_924690 [compost metagenome]